MFSITRRRLGGPGIVTASNGGASSRAVRGSCPTLGGLGGGAGAGGGSGSGGGFGQQGYTQITPVAERLETGTVAHDWIPQDTRTLNRLARLIYLTDPVAGPAIDFYREVPFGPANLGGIRDEKRLQLYNDALDAIKLERYLPYLAGDILVTGRVITHMLINESKGYWEEMIVHDCLTEDALILTEHGYFPVCDLPAVDVLSSDGAVSGYRSYGKVAARSVEPRDEIYELKGSGCLPLRLTGSHTVPIRVRTHQSAVEAGHRRKLRCLTQPARVKVQDIVKIQAAEGAQWRELTGVWTNEFNGRKDLQHGLDRIEGEGVSLGVPIDRSVVDDTAWTEDLIKTVGLYIAEGHLERERKPGKERGRVQPQYIFWTLGGHEDQLADDLLAVLGNLSFVEDAHKKRQADNKILVRCTSLHLWNLLDQNVPGERAHLKRLSMKVMQLPLDKQALLLEWMHKGDGCGSADTSWSGHNTCNWHYGSASRLLIMQVQQLLLRRGVWACISKIEKEEHPLTGTSERQYDGSPFEFYNINCNTFETPDEREATSEKKGPRGRIEGDVCWVPLTSIEKVTDYKGKLYDVVGVADWSSYSANGYWVGNSDYITVEPSPIIGEEPVIDLIVPPSYQKWATSPDPRIAKQRKRLDHRLVQMMAAGATIPLSSENTIFVPRRASANDDAGTSLFTRILPVIAVEWAYLQAEVTGLRRRAAPWTIAKVGIEDKWEASPEEMVAIQDMLVAAEEDPVGAKLVLRNGIEIEQHGGHSEIAKWLEQWQTLKEAKLQGLGMNEAFATGEASWSYLESMLSLGMERIRNFRQFLATEIVKEGILAPLARYHGFYKRTQAEIDHNVRTSPNTDTNLDLPTVEWGRSLQPTADRDYLDILSAIEEKGVPVSMRKWAQAAGYDLDEALHGMDSDIELQKKVADHKKKLKEVVGGGEDDDEGGHSFGSAQIARSVAEMPVWQRTNNNEFLTLRRGEVPRMAGYLDGVRFNGKRPGTREWNKIEERMRGDGIRMSKIRAFRYLMTRSGYLDAPLPQKTVVRIRDWLIREANGRPPDRHTMRDIYWLNHQLEKKQASPDAVFSKALPSTSTAPWVRPATPFLLTGEGYGAK